MRCKSLYDLNESAAISGEDYVLIVRNRKGQRIPLPKFIDALASGFGGKNADWVARKTILGGELYENTALAFTSQSVQIHGIGIDDLVAGREYIVNWNGTDYTVTAEARVGGDISMVGYTEKKELVFTIYASPSYSDYVLVTVLDPPREAIYLKIEEAEGVEIIPMPTEYLPKVPVFDSVAIRSSTQDSEKLFLLTVDDAGTLSVNEYVPPIALPTVEIIDNLDTGENEGFLMYESGMTWEKVCASEYNTLGLVCTGTNVTGANGSPLYYYNGSDKLYIEPSDLVGVTKRYYYEYL